MPVPTSPTKKQAPLEYTKDNNIHAVKCTRMGGTTTQLVYALVGHKTTYIRYLCKSSTCFGQFHLWALDPKLREEPRDGMKGVVV